MIDYFIISKMGCCKSTTVADLQFKTDPLGPSIVPGNFQVSASVTGRKLHPVVRASFPIDFEKQKEYQSFSVQQQRQAQRILQNFEIAKLMKKKLESKTHTSDQLRQVIDAILSTIQEIEEGENAEEKQTISQIFKNASEMGIQEKLFYHLFVETFKNQMKGKEIKSESLSRIYYNIANIKKQYQIYREGFNEFGIDIKTINGYNRLTSEEINEVVKLEAIGAKVEQLGARMKMKYASIEKESENIISMLAECLSRYEKDILRLKYDLNKEEVMKVATISRDACNYHDSGIVLLLIYLVKACQTLEASKYSVQAIEEKMKQAISSIFDKYPPGEGLKKEQEDLKKALEGLKYKAAFSHQPSKFTSKDNKQNQLEKIIMEYAITAKRNKDDFEELIRQTCLNLAIQTKVGLKLNPDSPNNKSIIRIKEKMLFRKDQVIKTQEKGKIQQTLKSEDDFYKSKIDQLLQKEDRIQFKVSDMVRGKCVFLQINDIVLTVQQIKAFVKKDGRFRITEIQSRFTNKIPISDVTLKIAINEEIVAELQLTIQANVAAYNFSHKIYQLQRAKVFSKIKISHNYYEEFSGDFKELTLKAIDLSAREMDKLTQQEKETVEKEGYQPETKGQMSPQQKYSLILLHTESIRNYIDLKGTQGREFVYTIMKALSDREKPLPIPTVSTTKQLQGIMLPIFNMEMGVWSKELGKDINSILQSKGEYSELLKSTLLYFFFKKFALSKEIARMQQFFMTTYQEIAEKLGHEYQSIRDGINFMKIYLNEIFSIKRPFDYAQFTAKTYYQAIQIQSICIQVEKYDPLLQLVIRWFVQAVVIEENTPETVASLMQFLYSYFLAIEESPDMIPFFNRYYSWLIDILNKQPKLDSGLVKYSAEFFNAQLLLKKQEYQQAQIVLKEIAKIFKLAEQQEKWLECQLLLAECKTYEINKIQDFKQQYQQVVKMAKALGLEMRGKTVANSEWRIYQQLMKNIGDSKEQLEYIEQNHLRKALTESNRTEGNQFIKKMLQADGKGHDVLNLFTNMKNQNVQYILLKGEERGVMCCKIISNAGWKNLTSLYLNNNHIVAEGCGHLAKAGWTKLTSLNLWNNSIGAEGCGHLIKAGWSNLASVNLDNNDIGADGCRHLSKAEWTNLTTLYLNNNSIGAEGCCHLSKAGWKNLTSLQMDNNDIGAEGCGHLIKAGWSNLASVNLGNNSIYAEGCCHLSKAGWKNLTSLNLNHNSIDAEGCGHLSKAGWTYLTYLNLWSNIIDAEGCCHLSKAGWTNLTSLHLTGNNIDSQQKQFWREQFKKLWSQCGVYI